MVPVILPGDVGLFIETAVQTWVELPQPFIARAQTLPSVLPKTTLMAFEPIPEVTTASAGTVHA